MDWIVLEGKRVLRSIKDSAAHSSNDETNHVPSSLRRFPPEIRVMIFVLCVADWGGTIPSIIKALRFENRVDNLLYFEAITEFYKINYFRFHAGNHYDYQGSQGSYVMETLWKVLRKKQYPKVLDTITNVELDFRVRLEPGYPYVWNIEKHYNKFENLKEVYIKDSAVLYQGKTITGGTVLSPRLYEDSLRYVLTILFNASLMRKLRKISLDIRFPIQPYADVASEIIAKLTPSEIAFFSTGYNPGFVCVEGLCYQKTLGPPKLTIVGQQERMSEGLYQIWVWESETGWEKSSAEIVLSSTFPHFCGGCGGELYLVLIPIV